MTAISQIEDRGRAQRRVRWELLRGLIAKDLKVKYQGSVLGFVWSLANPLMLLVVYTFVFQVVLKNGIPRFGYYLLAGLLIWNFFSGSVGMATEAVVGNAGLVKKVRFPLGVLPLTPMGFNAVHFGLQTLVLLAAMSVTGDTHFAGVNLLLAVPAALVALIFTTGLCFLVSALNVRYRDTKHLVEIILMAGFWGSPIVYSISLVHGRLAHHHLLWQLYLLNPMTSVAITMQRALYGADPLSQGKQVLADPGLAFYLERLAYSLPVALAFLALGLYVYHRLSGDFAEEL